MDWIFGKKKEEKKDDNPLGVTIQLDKSKLQKLQNVQGLNLPKKPKMKTRQDLEEEKEMMAGKEAFDLDTEYDLTTYQGRFFLQVNKVNPLLFFTPKKRIEEARDELFKFKLRAESAKRIDGKVFLTPEERDRVRKNNFIVGSAVHPDTNQIIPFYMRLSGFVVFNFPLVFAVMFVRN